MSDKPYSTDWKVAADPKRSAWVSANAGAGKTHTLANRVARLLLDDAPPAKILCLTYTKAAAAEMQGRLFDQLGKWAMLDDAALTKAIDDIGGDPKDLPKARRLFARALETPGGLKIQTIHAFCERLLSRFPVEAAVPPSFRVLDEQTARELLADARAKVLERAGTGEEALAQAVGYLVTQTSETRLNQILDSVSGGDRRKLEAFFDGLSGEDALRRAVERAHGAGENETYESIAGDFCGVLDKEEAQLREIIGWLSSGGTTDRDKAEALQEYLDADSPAQRFEALRDGLLTKGELYKKYAAVALAKARPELLERFVALANRIHAAAQRCKSARAAQLAHAALTVVDAMRHVYAAEKNLRGMLDYDDLIANTLKLLNTGEEAAWVLYKLDGGLDHILIDEAQDTSPEQWEIVKKFTEEMFAGVGREREHERTIFVVGDEKQSIYSFQGAKPEQFEENKEYFSKRTQNFADVRLETSRRSVPQVLGFVDEVFADDAAREGLSRDTIKHAAHRANDKGRVELWTTLKPVKGPDLDYYRLKPIDVESKTSPVAQLADLVAARISDWIVNKRRLPGRNKPITAGDIMILMPRREPFASEIIRRLKEKKIDVAGADRMKLTDQIAVMDIVALGRFVLLPEDDLNLAALLRSPLIDMSEDELRELAYGRKGQRLWSTLTSRRGDIASFGKAHAYLSEMLSRADYAPPYEFYSHALVEKEARHKLLARLGPEAADALDEFVSLALTYEQNNTPSLEGFLHWLERGEAEIKRDMDRGRDEVRVMTVHGSKGLEADIVILPDTTTLAQGAGRHGEFLFRANGDVVFPLSNEDAPQTVRDAKAEADEAVMRERRRLLYVALTRAKDRLIVCGFENTKGVAEGSWYDLTRKAAEKMGLEIVDGEDKKHANTDTEPFTGEDTKPTDKVPLTAWMRQPAPKEIVKPRLIRASDAAGLEEPATLSPLSENGAKRFLRGNLIHALLARLPEIAPDEQEESALRYLRLNNVADDDARQMARETLAVMRDPTFAAVFAPGSRAEVALVADLSAELGDGARLNGRIDRLAITPNEVLIVDFKTNRPPPATAQQVSTVYKAQMALYKAALSKLFPGHRITCALVWTDTAALMPLPDAMLEAEIGAIRQRLDAA